MRRFLVRIAALLLGTVVTLLAGEAVVRILQYSGRMDVLSVRTEQWLNITAVNAQFNAKILPSTDPQLGWELDPKDANINSLGIRGREATPEKPPNTLRIAVLGDSYAYGYSVAVDDAFPTQLDQRLNATSADRRFEVLNFSVIGYGTAQELRFYETKVRAFHPDVVVLAYVFNDIFGPEDQKSMVMAMFALRQRFDFVSRWSQFLAWVYSRWNRFTTDTFMVKSTLHLYGDESEMWQTSKDALRRLQQMTKADGARLVTVIFPWFTPNHREYPFGPVHEHVDRFLESEGIAHLDLLPVYGADKLSEFHLSEADGHPNVRGHRVAAETLQAFLERNGFLRSGH